MRLIVVSGQSGAGKSVALRVLEDLGYYCVDNLPVSLLNDFVESVREINQNVAVSIDIRNLPKEPQLVTDMLEQLDSATNIDVNVLFLDASKQTLLKRYSETRRIHPLSIGQEKLSLEQAIDLEKTLLTPLAEQASIVIDSSDCNLYELSEKVRFKVEGKEKQELIIVFQSFGFKYGLPSDADYVFDVRFLPNPHWEPGLRPLTGLDAPIHSFLEKHTEVLEIKQQIQGFVEQWLPMLEKNNRSYLTVAIGCTGGKHRSVYLTQKIGEYFEQLGHQVQIRHASLEKHQQG
ncbi:RNase adapter RapZ [Vibrio sp. 10N.261.46.E12]|uniref:RNase adapter RapZ n=1 Tax=unclassified Vibrio TaxID=2614977 RepID=UPI000976A092|nr:MULTISPECIES: RNase adapter RapZ [unclassified Vibrio]OMO33746.1 RNase adaptor protein RapZ [Vibrio sp. 10N.261.45.E1]PMJ23629.1 RNase adaptor protein RapZ [Vibrio sp. 10N.286.45.B6]PML96262.1 RNase adaptor protein RapZ [Vibrio sp. 10N.261.49.E11]PMM72389.1 RNase adaptor protein RapZ [Vibrio sp. 10N.261.46.F12]PMM89474.1 RNase adaptor protein RapZ [Vibrio sp. 10N.261.46.E8]